MKTATRLERLAERIDTEFAAYRTMGRIAIEHGRRCGRLLLKARAAVPHGGWLPWLKATCRVKPRQAQKLMRLARRWPEIERKAHPDALLELSIDSALGLVGGHDSVATVWGGCDSWRTPAVIVEAARAALGGAIDLDPASSLRAQETVRAERYFTAEDDGLSRPWSGAVFLNPPFCKEVVCRFVDKLLKHVQSGEVSGAVLLVNAATSAGWFQRAMREAAAVCFLSRRVRFLGVDGGRSSPTCGQAVFYFGGEPGAFLGAFGPPLGTIVRVWP